jgi:uncharacterized protein YggU (UPF0235/DUF167 family)
VPAGRPWSVAGSGVTLAVRLTPKGGRDAIEGVETLADGRVVLKARVRAVPEDGKANAALLRLVADAVGLPGSRVSLAGGATSRLKTLRLDADETTVAAALGAYVG